MVLYCQTPDCGFSYDDDNTCAPGPDPACPYCGGTEYKATKPLPTSNRTKDAEEFLDKLNDILLNGEFERKDAVNALIVWKYGVPTFSA